VGTIILGMAFCWIWVHEATSVDFAATARAVGDGDESRAENGGS
jgi:hypothetical protein